jgi:hypothetical protein
LKPKLWLFVKKMANTLKNKLSWHMVKHSCLKNKKIRRIFLCPRKVIWGKTVNLWTSRKLRLSLRKQSLRTSRKNKGKR